MPIRRVRRALRILLQTAAGAVGVLVVGFVVYLESRPDLAVWHRVHLDEEFRADGPVTSFAAYRALEERLFAQLDALVYDRVPVRPGAALNRYARGSLADPSRWAPDWNRSFELRAEAPRAGVLLLHGMSDSPYSLRSLGQQLHAAGATVVGLRIPGHGTAPAGLVDVRWQDMAAAVRIAVRHLREQTGDGPIFLVGYSNGAALAVHYALSSLDDEALPRVAGLALLSPAIGVTPVAALAVWQGRLGRLLGLDKLAWNSIGPEYDPYKYVSFAVNAGDQTYRITREIQTRIRALAEAGALDSFPPVLAFQSVVDATVSAPALVNGLFARLPPGGHELVVFDINRLAAIEPLLRGDPGAGLDALLSDPKRAYTLSVVRNASRAGPGVVVRSQPPAGGAARETALGSVWPRDVYSLAHVSLPFPPDDPVYGGTPTGAAGRIRLGNVALRGERGVLEVSATDMLRLRWNPFHAYLTGRTLGFVGLGAP